MDGLFLIWLSVIVVFLVIEILTTSFFSICFSIAAIPALILHVLGFTLLIQLIVYAITLAILLYYLIPVLKKMSTVKIESGEHFTKTNLDLIINKTGVCVDRIALYNDGVVKVAGKEWTAKVEKDQVIEKEDLVVIKKIIGSKIIVEKKESEE